MNISAVLYLMFAASFKLYGDLNIVMEAEYPFLTPLELQHKLQLRISVQVIVMQWYKEQYDPALDLSMDSTHLIASLSNILIAALSPLYDYPRVSPTNHRAHSAVSRMNTYRGKLNFDFGPVAKNEGITVVFPLQFRIGDPVYTISQWTQTSDGALKENYFNNGSYLDQNAQGNQENSGLKAQSTTPGYWISTRTVYSVGCLTGTQLSILLLGEAAETPLLKFVWLLSSLV
ncbi:hypothetical protein BDP27DRAFT_1370040 [Rhodocollybia butyracea]|uniref:Uncharacterized protein n=1 Tax=Rhodocollybia butyracea TaxID=206335 RepID=A0A9P5TYZ8_9AGAR|nr:hypothetical protein BDP27DRAFT_1370040 [Rhodocollybia butyracea]